MTTTPEAEHPLDAKRRRTDELSGHNADALRAVEAFTAAAIDPHNPNEWRNNPGLAQLHRAQLREVLAALTVADLILGPGTE